MTLVLENVVNGFSGLFSHEEKLMSEHFKDKLSVEAQTLFARMLTRKRTWYSVKDHLANYGEFGELQPALKELIDSGFIFDEKYLHIDLLK